MKWNKSARMLTVVAAVLIAPAIGWAQVTIKNNGTGTPVNPIPGGVAAGTTTAVNGGAGINPATGTLGTGGNGLTGADAAAATAAGFGTGLAGTSHDFVSGTGSSKVSNGAGLCTYCHTPHKAKSTLLLWNHTLSSNTFQWDVAATTSGTALAGFKGNAYNGPSAKCLSCHDGSVAIGDIGWFQESVPAVGTGSSTATDGSFKIGQTGLADGAAGSTTKQVGAGGNLSGNHPVAVPYPLNNVANVYNGITTGAALASADWQADPAANGMRIYSDIGGGAIVGTSTAGTAKAGQSGIECSSCHDPHNKAAKDDFFLRGKLTGSTQASGYICLQCHVK